MSTPVVVTKRHARKVLEVVNAGLVHGVGKPEPGKMCVEAAVCYALGEPHGDQPSCVGEAVRRYKIRLNDANWPSDQARTEGLREIAIAQLGSNEIDQKEFARRVTLKVIQQIIPIALRSTAKVLPKHEVALNAAATACEVAADFASAKLAIGRARNVSAEARSSAADAYAYAYAYTAATAAADADAATAADYAYDAASAAAAVSAAAAARAAHYAAAAAYDADRLKILRMAADIGVSVLKELACKGTRWLDLVKP